ncbi:MAG: response regulator [Bryobacterales bacterium]|nr:response regulator [Bryobacterales bacterium]
MAQSQDAILLRDAVAAAKAGNKTQARQLLRQASVHNSNNELVWLWRASLSESPKEAIFYLGEVLRINPANQKATAWLSKCRGASGGDVGGPVPVESTAPTQTVTAVPAPAIAAVSPAATTATSSLLRVAESVGTATIRPEAAAPPATNGQSYARVTDLPPMKPAEPAVRPRPTVIPFSPASKGATAPAIQPQAAFRWRCPFCGHGADSLLRRCPNCRSVAVLEDLKEIEKNEGIQDKLVREGLAKLEVIPAEKRTFEQNATLALGHLNLREATAALPYLKAASQQKKNDWALMGILDQIQWRKVILVVDDSLTIRKALSSILEKNDYRVVTAEDGNQALKQLNEAVPDLVLLDITMPWMDGYDVCKHIKSKALTRRVPVVMLSGKDGLFDKVRGKLAGCNDYVTKPFDPDGLLKTIRRYLS